MITCHQLIIFNSGFVFYVIDDLKIHKYKKKLCKTIHLNMEMTLLFLVGQYNLLSPSSLICEVAEQNNLGNTLKQVVALKGINKI